VTSLVQLRAGIYDRESKGSETSINGQNALNLAAVAANDWTLAGQYTDGSSASRFGRKIRLDWAKFLSDLDAGLLDVVVTTEPSRADRDLETWVPFVAKCRRLGVLIHLSGDEETLDPRKPSHWKRLIDGGVNAAFEVERISQRTRRGVAQAALNGGFPGHMPYGYCRVIVGEESVRRGSKMVKKLIKEQRPHSEHSEIVREIIERVSRNDPISSITADLNDRAVPSPEGGQWNRKTVRHIAMNVAYVGQRLHLGEVHKGNWKALVEVDVFFAAGQVLKNPARKKSKPGRLKWLLSYLAVGPCGATLHYMPPRQGRAARYQCVENGCATIAAGPADEYVTRAAIKRLSQVGARDLFVPPGDDTAQAASDEAARLRGKLIEARESYALVDGISAASLAEIERRLTPLIEAADLRAVPASTSKALLDLLSAAETGEQLVRPVWDGLAVAARREVLKVIFGEIRVGKLTRRLTRVSTREDRYVAAAERITFGLDADTEEDEAELSGSASAVA
jgi:site-specific DNA recombinase